MPLTVDLRTVGLGDEITTDAVTADRLIEAGAATPAEDQFDGMTVRDLRAFAEKHDPPIEIPEDVKAKPDLLAVIRTATFEEN
jgi:hypothetical protein